VMRTLLESGEFWNPDNKLFKTPMDFACSALAAVQGSAGISGNGGGSGNAGNGANSGMANDTPDRRQLLLTAGFLAGAGQPLHGWQTPDGYKFDAATWLAPEALTRRADFALAVARQVGDLDFLQPYLSAATRAGIAQEKPALRAGLMLASPDFQYK
jgi:uncharacterized protein (DUF1800 family)